MVAHPVVVPIDGVALRGDLTQPAGAKGLVVFAHGAGAAGRVRGTASWPRRCIRRGRRPSFSTCSPRTKNYRTHTRHLRFDIGLLARRLVDATAGWRARRTRGLKIGYFGASTGGGAASSRPPRARTVAAVVSRGGRPDLAGDALAPVQAPTLLIVGGNDTHVIELNRQAMARMSCRWRWRSSPGPRTCSKSPALLKRSPGWRPTGSAVTSGASSPRAARSRAGRSLL